MRTKVGAAVDLTNYFYLLGRAGGQSAIGGTGNGDPLTFTATTGTAGPISFYATPGSRVGLLTISNLAFGLSAQANMGAGTDNISIGRLAMGVGVVTGIDNIAIGRSSLLNVTSGYTNVAIGYLAMGTGVVTGWGNVAIGESTLEDCDTGRENVAIGQSAGANLTTGRFNVVVGSTAMSAGAITGDNNVAIGYGAALNMATASENIAIGLGAMGTGVVTGPNNVAIGQNTLEDCTSGNVNVAIGYQALLNLTSGATNTAIGNSSMGAGTVTGSNNVAYGFRTAYNLTSGAYNTAIGYLAMGTGVVTGTDNIGVGQSALSILTSGADNIGIGRNSGVLVTTGTLNTYVGALAGSTGVNAATLTKSAAIGYNALVSANGTMVFGGTGADAVAVVIGATAAVNEEVLSVIGGIYTANAGAAIYWESGDGASALVSKAATGRIRYNNTGSGTFQISTQTGAYSDILTTASAGLANYFYLPGRAGGQIGYGSNLAGENLTLSATSHGTPGSVYLCATGTTPIATVNQYGLGVGVAADATYFGYFKKNQNAATSLRAENTNNHASAGATLSLATGTSILSFGAYPTLAGDYALIYANTNCTSLRLQTGGSYPIKFIPVGVNTWTMWPPFAGTAGALTLGYAADPSAAGYGYILAATSNYAGEEVCSIQNTSTNAAALAIYRVACGTGGGTTYWGDLGVTGSSFTPNAGRIAQDLYLSANTVCAALSLITSGAAPIRLVTTATERMRILAGSNTLQGNAGLTLQGGAANGNDLTLSATAGTVGDIYFCNTAATATMTLLSTGTLVINAAAAAGSEKLSVVGGIYMDANAGMSWANQTDRAGASAGTLANAPSAGDPVFWVPIVINGTTRAFPVWALPA